jgi:hypothetical protein
MRAVLRLYFTAQLLICVANANQQDELSKWVVYLSNATPIMVNSPGSTNLIPALKTVSGSGMLVANGKRYFIITAKHVAVEMGTNCEMIIGGANKGPVTFFLGSLTTQTGGRWYNHPIADLSVCPIMPTTQPEIDFLNSKAAPLYFLNSDTNPPPRDFSMTAYGFPLNFGVYVQFVPLIRETKASSESLMDTNGYFYLLQDPSVSGYSGGPLIQVGGARMVTTPGGMIPVNEQPTCWGFVSGTYPDETGGKMCRIVPSYYAIQLINDTEKELEAPAH